MMNPALRPDASLTEFLVARARAASDGRLVADVLVGALAALVIAIWRPTGWLTIGGAALALAAFGVWGITDREVRDRSTASSWVTRALRIARAVAGIAGFCSGVVALFAVLGVVLGTWIS
jgi:hypothetical protein